MKGKPFKETKVGKFLSERVPDVLDQIDDHFPPAKILTALVGTKISPEDQVKFDTLLLEYEQTDRKDHLADIANARSREVEFVKATGHIDWLMTAVCAVVLIGFGFCLYVSAYHNIPEDMKDSFLEMRTTVRDAIIMILSFYFGASMKREKKVLV